jgi:hypothetical protein
MTTTCDCIHHMGEPDEQRHIWLTAAMRGHHAIGGAWCCSCQPFHPDTVNPLEMCDTCGEHANGRTHTWSTEGSVESGPYSVTKARCRSCDERLHGPAEQRAPFLQVARVWARVLHRDVMADHPDVCMCWRCDATGQAWHETNEAELHDGRDPYAEFPLCIVCGEPIDYCPGHGGLPEADQPDQPEPPHHRDLAEPCTLCGAAWSVGPDGNATMLHEADCEPCGSIDEPCDCGCHQGGVRVHDDDCCPVGECNVADEIQAACERIANAVLSPPRCSTPIDQPFEAAMFFDGIVHALGGIDADGCSCCHRPLDADDFVSFQHALDMAVAHDPSLDEARFAELLRTGSVRADGYIDPALWNEADWQRHDAMRLDPSVTFDEGVALGLRAEWGGALPAPAAPTDTELYACRDCRIYSAGMVLPHRPGGDPATWEVWAPRIPGLVERRLVDMVPCDRHLEQQHAADADEDGVAERGAVTSWRVLAGVLAWVAALVLLFGGLVGRAHIEAERTERTACRPVPASQLVGLDYHGGAWWRADGLLIAFADTEDSPASTC